jgi:hypothetical protein
MRRLVWLLAAVATFSLGWAAAAFVQPAPPAVPDPRASGAAAGLGVAAPEQPVEPRAGGHLMAGTEPSRGLAPRAAPDVAPGGPAASERAGRALGEPGPAAPRRDSPPSALASTQGSAQVRAALDRFRRYLDAINDASPGRERWRQARQLMDELRAMGPAAGQALMQVLATSQDSEERRAAARLLGQLDVAQALPLLRDVIERDSDILLRRAAAAGLRQLQTPEAVPVMERILTHPGEDRYVRLSAAVGLAASGRPLGITGLAAIFEESTADGRGRELAFRALAGLKDERSLPFMREVAASQAEPGYRLQAIRYLSALGDQQSVAMLDSLARASHEQPSIRDAAAQAYAAISGGKR